MELALTLFRDAWEHRRRRNRAIAAGVLLVAFAIVAGLLISRSNDALGGGAAAGARRSVPASRVLAGDDVRVVGISRAQGATAWVNVALKHPAESVVATVDGRSQQLRSYTSSRGQRTDVAFYGTFRPASLQHVSRAQLAGAEHPNAKLVVNLAITYKNGATASTELRLVFRDYRGYEQDVHA